MRITNKSIQKVFRLREEESQSYLTTGNNPNGLYISQQGYTVAMRRYPDAKYIVEEYELQLIGNDVGSIMACIENMIKQLNEIFGSDIMGWHSINYQPRSAWMQFGDDEVSYTDISDENDPVTFEDFKSDIINEEKEFMYSFEIYGTSVWYADGFTAFVGNDGGGSTDIYIFNKAMQIKDITTNGN